MNLTPTRNELQVARASTSPHGKWVLAGLALSAAVLATGCQHATAHTPVKASGVAKQHVIALPPNSSPDAMTLSSDGALWVAENELSAIARVDAAGHIRQYRIPGSSVNPDGILQGPDGRIWFSGFEVIGQLTDSGRMTGWEAGNGPSPIFPHAITLGPDGSVWYTNETSPRFSISRVSDSEAPSTVAFLPKSNFIYPAGGIAAGPDNAVWFSEVNGGYGRDAIGRVATDGRYTAWALPPATVPQSIVAGPDHAMWFTERTGIGRITASGTITSFSVRSEGRPTDIIPGPDGALWFTTSTLVGRITTSGRITTWSIPGAKSLSSIVAAPRGRFWLADEKASIIRAFTPRLLLRHQTVKRSTAPNNVYFTQHGNLAASEQPEVKPSCKSGEDCVLFVDGGSFTALMKMTWSNWTSTYANGTGSLDYSGAIGTAASGHVPVKVLFDNPKHCTGRNYWSQVDLSFPSGAPKALKTYLLKSSVSAEDQAFALPLLNVIGPGGLNMPQPLCGSGR